MGNVITLGKLIGLLFLFCHPLLSILFLKLQNKRNDLARSVMSIICIIGERSQQETLWCVQSSIEIYIAYYTSKSGICNS